MLFRSYSHLLVARPTLRSSKSNEERCRLVLDRQILSFMMVLVKVEIEGRAEKGVGVNFGIVGAPSPPAGVP